MDSRRGIPAERAVSYSHASTLLAKAEAHRNPGAATISSSSRPFSGRTMMRAGSRTEFSRSRTASAMMRKAHAE